MTSQATLALSARAVHAENYASASVDSTLFFLASFDHAYGCVDGTQRHATELA